MIKRLPKRLPSQLTVKLIALKSISYIYKKSTQSGAFRVKNTTFINKNYSTSKPQLTASARS